MEAVRPKPQRTSRAEAEAEALAGVVSDGRKRLATGKVKQVIVRMTHEKRLQLERLADAISAGRAKKASFNETIEMALDALEDRLKSGKGQ